MKSLPLTMLAILLFASIASANPRFIHPGMPRVYPGDRLINPTSYPLIPTFRPTFHAGIPHLYPGNQLIVPTEFPLVPSCRPSVGGII